MYGAKVVCTLGVCADIASQLARQLTTNTTQLDVCEAENFEKFVCDGWRNDHKLRPEQGRISNDNLLQDRADDILRGYLNATTPPIDTPEDREMFGKLKEANDACMNEAEVKKAGIQPLVDLLKDIEKLYPASNSSISYKMKRADQLPETLLYLQKMSLSTLVQIYPGRDDKHPLERIVSVSPPDSLTLEVEYYNDTEIMDAYLSTMNQTFALIHPNIAIRGKALQISRQVVDFEKQVSAILPPIDDIRDVKKYYNIMSLSDTAKVAPSLGLDYIIKALSPPTYSHDRMITSYPEVIKKMADIVQNTTKETIQAYFMWRVLNRFTAQVLAPEIEPLRIFKNTLSGRDPTAFPERWRTCLNHVSDIDSLGWILGRYYAAQYFSEKGIKLADSIVTYLKVQYTNAINSLDWLDSSVKTKAIEKLNKMAGLMGFPEKLPVNVSDPLSVRNFYRPVNLTASYFTNTLHLINFATARSWSQLGTPYSRDEWQMTPQTVNAYNDINSNEIAFPAAILQTPYFHADLPAYLNFGVTGATVGHEVSHGFDYHGREFDSDGAFGDSWWTNRTDEEYRKRAQCFVQQFDKFTVPGPNGTELHINGQQTLDENIADAGGLDTAFLAWKDYVKDNGGQDIDLPGLEKWSHDQLFFVAYANGWCSAAKENALRQQVYGDVHAPARFRVTGPVMDSRYFRESFGCKVKEPTCKIW